MRLSSSESCSLQERTDQLVVEAEHLVEELAVFDVVTLLISIELHRICHQLLVGDVLEHKEVRLILAVRIARGRAVGLIVEES